VTYTVGEMVRSLLTISYIKSGGRSRWPAVFSGHSYHMRMSPVVYEDGWAPELVCARLC
jgi:hypothetical protein